MNDLVSKCTLDFKIGLYGSYGVKNEHGMIIRYTNQSRIGFGSFDLGVTAYAYLIETSIN